MQIKLIALDLDGTTLNSKGFLTKVTKETIEEAIYRKVHVVVATGRVLSALPEEILEIRGIQYVATSNGARLQDLISKESIYTNLIASHAIDNAVRLLKQFDFMMEAFIAGNAYIDMEIYKNIDVVGLNKKHSDYIIKTRTPVDNLLDFVKENNHLVENININFGRQEDKKMMGEVLKQLENVTITSSFDHNLEIGGATTSKADAIQQLCRRLGITEEEIMACGDSPNDEAMLKASGLPVAMANGKEQIKSIAAYITGSNDEDGVAQAIKKFVLT